MRGRLPDDLFYDRSVHGILGVEGSREEAGETGRAPAPEGPAEDPFVTGRVPASWFFHGRGRTPLVDLAAIMRRTAANPYRFAATALLVGFAAVFVEQAPILWQIVLGAPIFEELLKFGLALLIAYPLRFLVLRLPVAWAVGAGFGWLEHTITYSGEDDVAYAMRLVFHAGATGTSMALFHVLESSRDVRTRWLSTSWATLIHYANNALAVVLIGAAWTGPGALIAELTFISFAVAGVIAAPFALLLRRPVRRWARRTAGAVSDRPPAEEGRHPPVVGAP